jgi:hypothetical protein
MATPAVRIDLVIGGRGAVDRALASVSATAKQQFAANLAAQREAAKAGANAQISETERAAQAASRINRRMALEDARVREEAIKRVARESDKVARERARNEEKVTREADRKKKREEKASERAADAAVRGRRGLGSHVGQGAAAGFARGASMVTTVTGAATGAVGIGSMMNAAEERLKLGREIAQLSADVSEGGKTIDKKATIEKAQKVAVETGTSALSVAEAMNVASGEGGGRKGLDAFLGVLDAGLGDLALASGTSMQDLAKLSATMTNNGVVAAEKQMEVFRGLNAAAKAGNVNLRDEAERLMTVAGAHSAGGFAGTGQSRVLQAGALMQISKLGGAANREDAATAAKNFYNDLGSHEKKLKAMGVKTFGKDGKRVDAFEQFAALGFLICLAPKAVVAIQDRSHPYHQLPSVKHHSAKR